MGFAKNEEERYNIDRMTTEGKSYGGPVMKIVRSLMLSVLFALCGTLAADVVRDFSPPLACDGAAAVELDKNYKLDPVRGATFVFTGRYDQKSKYVPPLKRPGSYAVFFYKGGEFFFGIRNRKLYFYPSSAGDGSWDQDVNKSGVLSDEVIGEEDRELHQYVLTLSRYVEKAQGIDRTEVKLYLDGAPVAARTLDRFDWKDAGKPLVACGIEPKSRTFNPAIWNYTGSVEKIAVLDRALAESELRAFVLADKRLKPRFLVPKTLTASEQCELDPARGRTPEEKSHLAALRNAALLGRPNWLRASATATGVVTTLAGPHSRLTILDDCEYATVASFYDVEADRELLAWNNPFFEVVYWDKARKSRALSGLAPAITRRLVAEPVRKDGGWEFAFAGEHEPSKAFPFAFEYTMKFRYVDDRLEYTLTVHNRTPEALLQRVKFPALALNTYKDGNDNLLVPLMSGIVYKNAAANLASYSDHYPRGRAAMQMGAYYDAKGGVMFAVEDPRGRAKYPSHSVGKEFAEASFAWDVPYRKQQECNTFDPQCAASLTLFRGDWYDAGLAYRALLDRINPPWWKVGKPNPECPAWFRANAIWIGRWQNYQNYRKWLVELDALARWKKYVGSPGQVVHFYEWNLHFTRDWPHHRASPDFVDRMGAMQKAGYRVVPYINAHIWEEKDKRDEDYRWTKVGLPASVKRADGSPHPSWFGRQFYVICPATETYEKEMFRECDNLVIHGADGVYLDQIGAGGHRPCHSAEHGHLRADPDVWYLLGHYRVYRKLREHWKTLAPEAVTVGEDIAETTVGNLDGGLVWRWMNDGQVPLFPLVYSGRTQMIGLAWGDDRRENITHLDREAVPAKLTFQLFCGMQLGWFSIGYLAAPVMREHRPLIKQYAHLRTAMLEFFDRGMLARPPRFEKPQRPVAKVWGNQGTHTLRTDPLQACAWELDGVKAILVADTDRNPAQNTVVTTAPRGKLHIFYSDGRRESRDFAGGTLKLPVSLKYREFLAVLAVPEGKDASALLERFAGAFDVIAGANREPDPWDDPPKLETEVRK